MVSTKSVRNTVVLGFVPQIMFIVAAARLKLPLELFYLLFLVPIFISIYYYERDNPGELVVDTRQYKVRELWPQVRTGAAVGVLAGLPTILWGEYRAPPPATFAADFVTQVFFVAFVETLYLLVIVTTIRIGRVRAGVAVWPVLFGFLHVRDQVLAGTVSLETGLRFAYAAVFGALFWLLYEGREIMPPRYRPWFGAVTTWTAHAALNLIIIAFLLRLYGLELFPLLVQVILHG